MDHSKDELIIELVLCPLPEPFTINLSKETDLIVQFNITNQVMLDDTKISELEDYYYGYLLLDSNVKKAYYYEVLIDKGNGIDTYTTNRTFFTGIFQYKTYSFGGFEADGEINYPMVRDILENKLHMHGWKFELVLTKNEATYKRFSTPKTLLSLKRYFVWSLPILLSLAIVIILIYQLQDPSYRAEFFDIIVLALVFYTIRLIINKIAKVF